MRKTTKQGDVVHMPSTKKKAKKKAEPETEEAAGRVLWKGSISFGLIDIPVSLHSAENADDLKFSMLDKRDLSPVRYERFSAKSGKPVPWENIVKGFEYEDGRYVVVSEEELAAAHPEATQSVEIVGFLNADAIPPEYAEKPYYLQPTKRGRKGYALLYEVLRRTKRAGLAKVVIRVRQHLAALLPRDGVLMLEVLRWAHELKEPPASIVTPASLKALSITAKELDMAEKLVEGMVEEWDPEAHADTYREQVMAYIERRAKAGKFAEVETPGRPSSPARGGGEVIDFVSLLQQSLATKKPSGPAKKPRRSAPARPSARKRSA